MYNPQAGKLRRHPELLALALDELRQKWPEVHAVPTEGPQTAGRIVSQCIAQGAGLIVAAGGDGTINESVAGVAGTDVPCPTNYGWATTLSARRNCCSMPRLCRCPLEG